MSSLLHFFRSSADAKPLPNTAATSSPQAPVRALPASWYTSQAMYDFERRAIFSKRWLFLTHSSRLAETGDWLRYEIAGFDVIVTRNCKGSINAFHNACRRCASPVVEGEKQGRATELACPCRGKTDEREAKGEGDENGDKMLGVHIKLDGNGFIWVNLDARDPPEIPWTAHFANVDVQARYAELDFSAYVLDHTYELTGAFNWKVLADNFNECYHCPTTHPDVPTFINLESFDSDLKDGHIQHRCEATPEQVEKGLQVHSTYYFPAASMTVSKHFLMIQKFLPTSAHGSTMAYEIFRHRDASDADFHCIADMYERVMREDKVLCMRAQANLERGVFVSGLLHPRFEKAPLFFQGTVREVLREHWEGEEKVGGEVWPAGRGRVGAGMKGIWAGEEERRVDEVMEG